MSKSTTPNTLRTNLGVPQISITRASESRPSSLPRTGKGNRGKSRRAPPPPPPTLKDRLATIKSSPYFYPAVVALVAFLLLLIVSAVRIASHQSDISLSPSFNEFKPAASSSSPSSPSVTKVSLRPSMSPEDSRKAAREALEKTWKLEDEHVVKHQEQDRASSEAKVGLGEEELRLAKERFESLRSDMDQLSAEDLTQLLHAAYRGQE
ncbi:hypothetical protein MNV49_007245 [Pseudohyphozyma bogoriensis]|nr:hypothetical protein MNV49_007245 [Pseudohyphozyma bogoriensis]